MRSTLIILTLNEIEAVKHIYDQIPQKYVDEIIVIDGGSTDGTIDFFKRRGIPVFVQDVKGRGAAFRLGIKKAANEILIFFSSDGNERAGDIPLLIKKIKEGYDLVIASRFSPDAKSFDATFIRRLGNIVFTKLVNLRWRSRLTDVFNGFRGGKKECLRNLSLASNRFEIELEMTIKSIKNGLRIAEIPTVEDERIGGVAKLRTWRDGFANFKCFLQEAFVR